MSITRKMQKLGSAKGFTLVELLVVIAIIGVLSTLVLLQLGVARAKARDAKRIADVNQLRTAVELYFDDHGGSYPGATLCAPYLAGTCDIGIVGAWNGGSIADYLSARVVPVDPLSGNDYVYINNNNAAANKKTAYHVYAELERLNAPAFAGDTDLNSIAPSFTAPRGGTGPGENFSAAASEACASVPNVDCAYDLGQAE